MTYKSPAYYALERRTSIIRSIESHVDLARDYRAMAYGGDLFLQGSDASGHRVEVRLGDNAKAALLKFMAQHHEDCAASIEATQIPADIDVRAASKV